MLDTATGDVKTLCRGESWRVRESLDDGKKIIYSASLTRNSAPGSSTPLWMISSIWEYDFDTEESKIVYTQKDGGCIGRVEWLDNDEVVFTSYYDFQGSRDNVNYFNLNTGKASVIFQYTDENYNNVTLLPVNEKQITYTSSAKDEVMEDSETYIYDLETKNIQRINLTYSRPSENRNRRGTDYKIWC